MFAETTALQRIANLENKIRCIQGGTAAGKTIATLLYLIAMAQTDKKKTLTSVVSESVPHLKRGALRDFKNIMQDHSYWRDSQWNGTDMIYTFETGSQIEFFSTDNGDKLRGARRDRCFMNEANNCTLDAFDQLEVRTKEFIILDWNPTNEFWVYTEVMSNREDVEHIILTYKDNEALPQEIIDSIESRKNRTNWWKVYGLGQLGEVEGKVYTGWRQIDEIPHEARRIGRGLDFGYSNDPSAATDIYEYNGGYILDELFYRKGMSNSEIATALKDDDIITVADSAEPKSIDEIKSYGVTIVPSEKGQGSVLQGITLLQDQSVSVTKRSHNVWSEYQNYLWERDKNGVILNKPEHGFNHCFVGSTELFTDKGKKQIQDLVGTNGYVWSRAGKLCQYKNVRATRYNTEVLTVHFDSGENLTVTPDHLLLQTDGTWKEASLLQPNDMIQSVMYEADTGVQRKNIYAISWREVLQSWRQKIASSCLGALQWIDTRWFSYTPQRQQPVQQPDRKPGVLTSLSTFTKPLDGRKKRVGTKTRKKNKTTYEEVAWVRSGKDMALRTWKESVCQKKGSRTGVRSLPQKIRNYTVFKKSAILPPELQNERPAKKVARVTRGRAEVVFNLDVEDTHCVWANGVIAHNCLDGVRYFLQRHLKRQDTNISDFYDKLRMKRNKRKTIRAGLR